jgi:hypothetical protein
MLRFVLLVGLLIVPAKASDPIYHYGGINVGVFSSTQLVIEPFSLWMWGPIGTPGFGGQLVEFTNEVKPDLTTIGCNGMDANPNGAGQMPPDGAYDIFAFYNPTTGDVCFINTLLGTPPTAPSGYTYYRKLPYGNIVLNGALAANHTSGWPMPTVMFTATERSVATFPSATNSWVGVDCSKLIPENARMGFFRVHVTGGNASVWLSPSNNIPNAYFKTLMDNQTGMSGQIGVRVDSREFIYVFTSGAGRVDLILDGFAITEATD